jgi:hypothetical protein
MRVGGSVLRQHREAVALLLLHPHNFVHSPGRRGLVTALCGTRGELNASGETEPIDGAERQAIGSLTAADLRDAIDAVDPTSMEPSLRAFVRASDDNGEDVSLAQPAAHAEALLEEGSRLLCARQDIENVMAGFGWLLAQRPELCHLESRLEAKRAQASRLDRTLRGAIRHFVPLNQRRRLNQPAYPDAGRFWWWYVLSECDLAAVHAAAEGERPTTPHLVSCRRCGEWLRWLRRIRTTLRECAPIAHPRLGDLRRLHRGELKGEDAEGLGWHLALCRRCASAIELLRASP